MQEDSMKVPGHEGCVPVSSLGVFVTAYRLHQ